MKRKMNVIVASTMLAIASASLLASAAGSNPTGQNLAGEQQLTQLQSVPSPVSLSSAAQKLSSEKTIQKLKFEKAIYERMGKLMDKDMAKLLAQKSHTGVNKRPMKEIQKRIQILNENRPVVKALIQDLNNKLKNLQRTQIQ